MNFVIQPSAIDSGVLTVPGDKSISHRALMLAAIADGRTEIKGLLVGDDCIATLKALMDMGVRINRTSSSEATVYGVGLRGLTAPNNHLDLGNSGTSMRLFSGLLSGQEFSVRLVGDDSLGQRPMARVIKPLNLMGAEIAAYGGTAPLQISGGHKLSGIYYRLPVASAQVKSAILLAGLYGTGEVVIEEPSVTRDHTERMLRIMGVNVEQDEGQIRMRAGQSLSALTIRIPADLSSASFLIVAATIAGKAKITITGVGVNPTRTGIISVLKEMGADISLENRRLYGEEPVADITIRSAKLRGIDVDSKHVSLAIDEFPALFIAAACAEGVTRFSGLEELRVKESDRITAMAEGLRALNVPVDESEDGATVHGAKIGSGTIHSYSDHRVAMAFAVAGTIAAGPVTVTDTRNVDTSFPGFVDSFKSMGISMSVTDHSA